MPDISISGNKMVKTIQKEFTEKFPYIRINIMPFAEKKKTTQTGYPGDTRIADVRKKGTSGDISISGNKLVKNLESEFETVYGLYAQVCFTDKEGGRYYTTGSYDSMTLSALNKDGEKQGWKKGITC